MWRFQVSLRPKEDQELPAIGRRVRATEHTIAILELIASDLALDQDISDKGGIGPLISSRIQNA